MMQNRLGRILFGMILLTAIWAPVNLVPAVNVSEPTTGGIPQPSEAILTPEEAIQRALAVIDGPATIDGEIGANDFRISDMGLAPDLISDAIGKPAVAFNSTAQEYLVVWSGDDLSYGMVDDEQEIWGRRISATTGALIEDDFCISDMGPDGDPDYDAAIPQVVYNPHADEYLVVWRGDDDRGSLVDGEYEIFGQRLEPTGYEVGSNDFRISDMGPDGNSNYSAISPVVAYNSDLNQYLVAWHGDNVINNEWEIYGQRLDENGNQIGINDFRISDMGPDGNIHYGGYAPAIDFNSTNGQYLVVWYGIDDTPPLVEGETEIFGQRLDGGTGAELGTNDFRISDMGPESSSAYHAYTPAVAYNVANDEYLVVWRGDDNTPPLVDGEQEIFGQRLEAATGDEVGTNDFRISDMGPQGGVDFEAFSPEVAYNAASNEYLVIWRGDDNTSPLVLGEFEIFGQRLNAATGSAVGTNDFRISDMGPNGSVDYIAQAPAVVYNPIAGEYLVVWTGDDTTPSRTVSPDDLADRKFFPHIEGISGPDAPRVDEEFEVYGQRLNAATGAAVGSNDFRISIMGIDMRRTFSGDYPKVAYNSTDNLFLVVWMGGIWEYEGASEIYGQLLNATNGARVGSAIQISDMGPDGVEGYHVGTPAVAYNATNNEFLVVWRGDDNTAPLVDDEREIFGQRLNAASGVQVGSNDFRISDMGPNGSVDYTANNPVVAYNSILNEYLVVWWGDDNTAPLVNDEMEIFGQRLNAASGAQVGSNDFRISDMGPNGSADYAASYPAAAHNPTQNEYLVVWHGDDNITPLVNDEREIFGQRLTAATGAQVGSNDFRISDMGPNGSVNYAASDPAVVHNPTRNEYLVVWDGDYNYNAAHFNSEREITGQRLNAATGAEVGVNDFRISDMGPEGNTDFDGISSMVAYNPTYNEYLVVWTGDDNTAPLVEDEWEIYGQRLDAASGAQVGSNDFRLSDMGLDGSDLYVADNPAVAYNLTDRRYLVVWDGNDNIYPLIEEQWEIFGQLLTSTTSIYLPLIRRK